MITKLEVPRFCLIFQFIVVLGLDTGPCACSCVTGLDLKCAPCLMESDGAMGLLCSPVDSSIDGFTADRLMGGRPWLEELFHQAALRQCASAFNSSISSFSSSLSLSLSPSSPFCGHECL